MGLFVGLLWFCFGLLFEVKDCLGLSVCLLYRLLVVLFSALCIVVVELLLCVLFCCLRYFVVIGFFIVDVGFGCFLDWCTLGTGLISN